MSKPLDAVAERTVREVTRAAIARLSEQLTFRQDEMTSIERRGQIMAWRGLIKWLDGETDTLSK